MIGELFDNLIGVFAPGVALSRKLDRASIANLTNRELRAGKNTRQNARVPSRQESGNLSQLQVSNLRNRAWDLVQNNPYANKAVRIIVAQVIGTGPSPQSSAMTPDGEPWNEFRERAHSVWQKFVLTGCADGGPGNGGGTIHDRARMVVAEMVTCGECFTKKIRRSPRQSKRDGVSQIAITLAESERIVDDSFGTGMPTYAISRPLPDGHTIYRGIELDANGQRVGYYAWDSHPADPARFGLQRKAAYWDAKDVIHTFWQQRPSQLRGWSWFAPNLQRLNDIEAHVENEINAATGASCVSLIVKKGRATSGHPLALQAPTGGDMVDCDGNPLTRMQPGMIPRIGPDDEIIPFDPGRPVTGMDTWVQLLLRGVSGGMPGVKASSLSQSFDRSFSAERAADNDIWREVEQLQEMVYSGWYQNLYADVIEAAIMDGEFDDIKHQGTNGLDFHTYLVANSARLSGASWHGPYQKSLNPAADENASKLAIQNITSSIPVEAAARGLDWKMLIDQQAEVIRYVKQKADEIGVQPEQILAMLATKVPADQGGKPAMRSHGAHSPATRIDHLFSETNGNGVLHG